MIKLEHDRSSLYQWDVNQRVIVEGLEPGSQVHFESTSVTAYEENGVIYADIPNELLQQSCLLNVYAYVLSGDEGYTKETAVFNINRREKPSDYDANIMFGDTVDEILGENITGSLTDKLKYLKDCLDILYQNPVIKLSREAYGENKTLKKLFEYLSSMQSYAQNLISGYYLTYSSDILHPGYDIVDAHDSKGFEVYDSLFIAPPTFTQPFEARTPFVIMGAYFEDDSIKWENVEVVDYGYVKFPNNFDEVVYDDDDRALSVSVAAGRIYRLILPKFANLRYGAVYIAEAVYSYVKGGIYFGKYAYTSSQWFCADRIVTAKIETPIYCEEGFFGTVHLEKFNIPYECLSAFIDNVANVKELYDDTFTLYIGDANLRKLSQEDLEKMTVKGWEVV